MTYTPTTSPTNFEHEILTRLAALENSNSEIQTSLTAIQTSNAAMETSLSRLGGSDTEGFTQDTAIVTYHTTVSPNYGVTANNSVYFEVPEGEEWIVQSLWVQYVCSATVGNRLILVTATPPAASTYLTPVTASVLQTASQSKTYLFAPGLPFASPTDAGFAHLLAPLPPLVLQSTQKILILDRNNVSPSGDSISPKLLIRKRSL